MYYGQQCLSGGAAARRRRAEAESTMKYDVIPVITNYSEISWQSFSDQTTLGRPRGIMCVCLFVPRRWT